MIFASLILNIAVIVFFIIACMSFFRAECRGREKAVRRHKLRMAGRYFTVQSNIFAAAVSVLMVIGDLMILYGGLPSLPFALLILKLCSTVSVMLTFFIVLFYLLPRFGLTDLFLGANFYMHLVVPLLSFFSLILCEGMTAIPVVYVLVSVIPVTAYGILYAYNVIFRRPEKAWDDMYLFNSNGKWGLILFLMLVITAVIGLLLLTVHNMILA